MNDKPMINPDDIEARTMFLKEQYFKKQLKEAEGTGHTIETVASVIYLIALVTAFALIVLTLTTLPREMWVAVLGVLVFALTGMHLLQLRIRHLEQRFDSILNTITQIKESMGS